MVSGSSRSRPRIVTSTAMAIPPRSRLRPAGPGPGPVPRSPRVRGPHVRAAGSTEPARPWRLGPPIRSRSSRTTPRSRHHLPSGDTTARGLARGWRGVGSDLERGMTLRVFLAGGVALEADGRVVDERSLPGLQGRVVLALLAAERERPLAREELAEELWAAGCRPQAWEPALRAVISKVRSALTGLGLDGDALGGAFGVYRLRLPPETWVDLEA